MLSTGSHKPERSTFQTFDDKHSKLLYTLKYFANVDKYAKLDKAFYFSTTGKENTEAY